MKKKKMPDPDKPLTTAEMNSGKWLHGIDELPKDAQKAIRTLVKKVSL